MIKEAEDFAAEDAEARKRVEKFNELSSFVGSLKNQVADEEGLGGKLASHDKRTLLDAAKEVERWLEDEGAHATVEDIQKKLQELQNTVSPISSKLYSDKEPSQRHVEL